jgi:hypothetical protein
MVIKSSKVEITWRIVVRHPNHFGTNAALSGGKFDVLRWRLYFLFFKIGHDAACN